MIQDDLPQLGVINSQAVDIGTFELLRYPRFLFAALAGVLGYFLYDFQGPILAIRMEEFNLSQIQIGLFFIVMPVVYIPTSILVQSVPKGVEKRAVLIIACFLSFFGNLFVGPSDVFSFPESIWFMIIGQALHGLIDPFILIPSLPEMIESVLPLYPESAETQINDISSGIFNMFLGIGQIIGPLYGSIVTAEYGFRYCCDLVSIICLVFAISYYVLADGQEAIQNSRWTNNLQTSDYDSLNSKKQRNRRHVGMLSIQSPCTPVSTLRLQVMRKKGGSFQIHASDDKYAKVDNFQSDDYGSEHYYNNLQSEKSAYSALRSKMNAEKQLQTDVLKEQLAQIYNEEDR